MESKRWCVGAEKQLNLYLFTRHKIFFMEIQSVKLITKTSPSHRNQSEKTMIKKSPLFFSTKGNIFLKKKKRSWI